MSAMTDYLENALFNAVLRGGTYTGGPVYLALCTSNPGESGTSGEMTDSGYSRKRLHAVSASDAFTAPANGAGSNVNDVVFPSVTDSSVTITHWVLFDAETGGNPLLYGALTQAKNMDIGDVPVLSTGDLQVTFQ